MAHEQSVERLSEAVTSYWIKTWERWRTAVDKYRGPGYQPADLSTDVVGFWVDTFDAWSKFMPSLGDPQVPLALLKAPAAAFTAGVQVSVYVAERVPAAGVLAVSDLVLIGDDGERMDGGSEVTLSLDSHRVQLTVRATTGAAPAQGVYQGIVTHDNTPLALVTAQVMP